MKIGKRIAKQRQARARRVRKRVRGTPQRPRLTVFRSNKHIYAQIIDDSRGNSLVSAGSNEEALRGDAHRGENRAAAVKVGKALAERALQAGIKQVAFDRGRYRYHGRIAALADAAREAGLLF